MSIRVPHCTHDFIRAERLLNGRWAQIFFIASSTYATSSLIDSVQSALHQLPSPDVVFIVVPGWLVAEEVRTAMLDTARPSLAERFERSAFRFFAASANLELTEIGGNILDATGPKLGESEWLPFIVEAIWSQCCPIELAPDGAYFAKSGGRPSLVFVRASRLAQYESQQFLIALLCLAQLAKEPRLVDVKAIHVDTTAISDIGHALAALQARFASEKNTQHGRPRSTVRAFQSYGGVSTLALNDFRHEIILISASTSGGLLQHLVNDKGIPRGNIVTVVGEASDEESNSHGSGYVLFDARRSDEYVSAKRANQSCKFDLLTPIHVDDSEFNFAPGKSLSVLLTAATHGSSKWAPNEKDVRIEDELSKVHSDKLTFLKIGSDKSNLSRRIFALDLAAMSAGPVGSFLRESVRDDARLHQKNLVVVVENDEGDRVKLVDHLSTLGTTGLSVIGLQDLAGQNERVDVDHVMICAAIVGSGYVLEDASRVIREKCPNATRAFYIGAWLPGTQSRAETLRRTISYSATPFRVKALSRVAVGNSLAGLTAANMWHSEKELLERITQPAASVFVTRLAALADPTGDTVVWNPGQLKPMQIGPTFAFWKSERSEVWTDGYQVNVLLTMAGVLQNARELPLQANGSLRQSAYQHRVLAAENFFRFNAPLIQGCLLRCAEPFEIDYSTLPDESGAIRAYVSSMIDAPDSNRAEALYEFMLSIALRRLKLSKDDDKFIRERGAVIPWCKGLLDAQFDR